MQARSYCLYCTYPPSSLGQIDDLRARLAALQQAAASLYTQDGHNKHRV